MIAVVHEEHFQKLQVLWNMFKVNIAVKIFPELKAEPAISFQIIVVVGV